MSLFRMMRSLLAAVALVSITLLAHAATETTSGVLPDGTPWRIDFPDNWNGTLLVGLDYAPNGGNTPTVQELLRRGYASSGVNRAVTGWSVGDSIENHVRVVEIFTERYGPPARVFVNGSSLGAHTGAAVVQARPDVFDGAVLQCGGLAGAIGLWNSKLDALFVAKTLLAPGDDRYPIIDVPDDFATNARPAWLAMLQAAQQTPEGKARIALAAAIAQLPAWSVGSKPIPAPDDYDALQEGLYDSLAGGPLPVVGQAMSSRNEINRRAGGNISWNLGVDYRKLLERVEHADVVRAMYEKAGLDLEADDAAAPALLERRFEEAHQILRLFLDFEIAVADDAEAPLPLYRVAWKELRREQDDELLESDEALRPRLGEVRQAHEALHPVRHPDQRIERAVVALAEERQRHSEAQVGDERERMGRVDGKWREHREDMVQEVVVEPLALGLRQLRGIDEDDAVLEQLIPQLAPAALLVAGELGDLGADARELLGRRQAVLRQRHDTGAHLAAQAGDAHHEELVEIIGRDGQEAQLLQKRVAFVGRFLQHPAVELEPGKFPVDETLGRVAQRLDVNRLGRGGILVDLHRLALPTHRLHRLEVHRPLPCKVTAACPVLVRRFQDGRMTGAAAPPPLPAPRSSLPSVRPGCNRLAVSALALGERLEHLERERARDAPAATQGLPVERSDKALGGGERTLHARQDGLDHAGVHDELPVHEELDQDSPQQRLVRGADVNRRRLAQARQQIRRGEPPHLRHRPGRQQEAAATAAHRVEKVEEGVLVEPAPVAVLHNECRRIGKIGHSRERHLRCRGGRGAGALGPDGCKVRLARPLRPDEAQHRMRPVRPALDHGIGRLVAGADEEILGPVAWRQRQVEG